MLIQKEKRNAQGSEEEEGGFGLEPGTCLGGGGFKTVSGGRGGEGDREEEVG